MPGLIGAPVDLMDPGDPGDKFSLGCMAREASEFLLSHKWCRAIKSAFVGLGYEGIVGVFYFQIEPAVDNVDEFLWVVVGDLPPAYLVCDDSPDAASALEAYIDEMWKWVHAVGNGTSLDGIIPVSAPPTHEYADMLRSRLEFLEKTIIPHFRAGGPDDVKSVV